MLVLQHSCSKTKATAKLRVTSKFDTSVVFKFPSYRFKVIATTSIGVSASNLATAKRSFQFGGQLEFNV